MPHSSVKAPATTRLRKKKRPKGVDLLLRDLPPKVHLRFKEYCMRRGLAMRTRILQLMRQDMEKRKVQELSSIIKDHNNETLRDINAARHRMVDPS